MSPMPPLVQVVETITLDGIEGTFPAMVEKESRTDAIESWLYDKPFSSYTVDTWWVTALDATPELRNLMATQHGLTTALPRLFATVTIVNRTPGEDTWTLTVRGQVVPARGISPITPPTRATEVALTILDDDGQPTVTPIPLAYYVPHVAMQFIGDPEVTYLREPARTEHAVTLDTHR